MLLAAGATAWILSGRGNVATSCVTHFHVLSSRGGSVEAAVEFASCGTTARSAPTLLGIVVTDVIDTRPDGADLRGRRQPGRVLLNYLGR